MPPKQNRSPVKAHAASSPRPQPSTVIAQAKFHSGPLPIPQDLDHYEQILEGAANRILLMAEAQISHRIENENRALQADIDIRKDLHVTEASKMRLTFLVQGLGQLLGTTVSITSLGLAAYTAMHGSPWQVTTAFLGLPVVAMINAITGNKKTDSQKKQ